MLVAADEPRPKTRHKTSLLEFFRNSPLAGLLAGYSDEEIDRAFRRDKTPLPPPIEFD